MDIVLAIIGVIAGVIGLLGVIIPVLPGTILSFIGMLAMYFTSTSAISLASLIFWGVISAVAITLDYILPGYFSKAFGGTKAGITGATIGTFAGIFLGIPGIIFGPFFGAVFGEIISGKLSFVDALHVGIGSMLSFLVGSGIKLIAGVGMIYYILKDIAFMIGSSL